MDKPNKKSHESYEPNSPVRIGIIGVGQSGQLHLKRYQDISNVDVVAICGRSEEKSRDVAKQYEIADYYTDYRSILNRDDIDAVEICLHNNFHRTVAEQALNAGKHVFCEKPMAGSYRDAEAMLNASKINDRKLSIRLSNLFHTETKVAKELVSQGKLGKIYCVQSSGLRRRGRPYVDGYGTAEFTQKKFAGGGAIYDMGVYHIAQILYIIGNPQPERMTGYLMQEMPMDQKRKEISGFDVEEIGMGIVSLTGGIVMNIFEAWAINLNNYQGSYVVGSDGGVCLSPFSYCFNLGDIEFTSDYNKDAYEFRRSELSGDEDAYLSPQHHWIRALQGKVELLPTAEIALTTMLITEGIALSNRLHREVTADEVIEKSVSTAIEI